MMVPLKLEWFGKYDKKSKWILQCDTCEPPKVFHETTLNDYCKMLGYDWDGLANKFGGRNFSFSSLMNINTTQFKFPPPRQWYIEAGRHWVDTLSERLIMNDGHRINVYVKHIEAGNLSMDLLHKLSEKWWEALLNQPKNLRKKEAFYTELNHLEKQLKKENKTNE